MDKIQLKKVIELCDLTRQAIKARYNWDIIDDLLNSLHTELKEGLKQIEKSKPGRRPGDKKALKSYPPAETPPGSYTQAKE